MNSMMEAKEIIKEIVGKHEVKHVVFVGCGASKADLYPAKYFLTKMRNNYALVTTQPTNSTTRHLLRSMRPQL